MAVFLLRVVVVSVLEFYVECQLLAISWLVNINIATIYKLPHWVAAVGGAGGLVLYSVVLFVLCYDSYLCFGYV